MSFSVFNTGFSSSNLAPVAVEPLWNAIQLNGKNIGDLSDVVDQAVLTWDAANSQWTWSSNSGEGGLSHISTNLVGTGNTTTVESTADQNVIIGLNSGANPAATNYIGNTTLGNYTLTNPNTNYGVAIGYQAGFTGGATGISLINGSFNSGRVLVGAYAGQYAGSNALDSIAVGFQAGQYTQSDRSVAIGRNAGQYRQGGESVAIGHNAGFSGQGSNSVSIGQAAGQYGQSGSSIGIGIAAGQTQQGANCVAIGTNSGSNFQYTGAIAIGSFAGYASQQYSAISIGFLAGYTNQASNAIAIGAEAGRTNQGSNSIALGTQAGKNNLQSNSICINATGLEFSPIDTGMYVNPIQVASNNNSGLAPALVYYTGTSEVAYNDNINFDTNTGFMSIQGSQVVGSRKNGYNVSAGSPTGTINFGTATLSQLSNFVNQLYNDLSSHGLINASP
jgi:hypothetical protein